MNGCVPKLYLPLVVAALVDGNSTDYISPWYDRVMESLLYDSLVGGMLWTSHPLLWRVLEHGSATVASRSTSHYYGKPGCCGINGCWQTEDLSNMTWWWLQLVVGITACAYPAMRACLGRYPIEVLCIPKGEAVLTVMSACGRMDVITNERGCLTSRSQGTKVAVITNEPPSLQTVAICLEVSSRGVIPR